MRRRRGELRITHAVLDSDLLGALDKLAVAAVAYFGSGYISLDAFESLLPATRDPISKALRHAERTGYLRIGRQKRRRGQYAYTEAHHYTLAPHANPRTTHFTRLRLDLDHGQSAERWVLRAVYERLQARGGMICVPDNIAGRKVGMKREAVRQARKDWKTATVRKGTKANPVIFTLADSPTQPIPTSSTTPSTSSPALAPAASGEARSSTTFSTRSSRRSRRRPSRSRPTYYPTSSPSRQLARSESPRGFSERASARFRTSANPTTDVLPNTFL